MMNEEQAAGSVAITANDQLKEVHELFLEARRLLLERQAEPALIPLRRILTLCPAQPDAMNLTSVAFGQLNMHAEAEKLSRQALQQRPGDPGFLLNLANRLKDQNRIDDANETYAQAAQEAPEDLTILKNYLDCLIAGKCWADAEPIVEAIAALEADDGELLIKCTGIYLNLHKHQAALDLHLRAIRLVPGYLPWLLQTARLAINLDQLDLAKEIGERVLALGENPEMRAMIASILHRKGDFEAMERHLDAIPDGTDQDGNAANLRGMMLASQAKSREALEVMERTKFLAADDYMLQCTRLMYLNYDVEKSRQAVGAEHKAFGMAFGQDLPLLDQSELALPHDSERKLHIGFVSPDLGSHSVVYFLRPFLEKFDRDQFDVTAYASMPREDGTSEALKQLVTRWRNVFHLSDQKLAETIRDDQVDILIDLAGLTRGNRLRAFTARPAPIQMTYIGYPNTTGLPAIDYRITDSISDPDDTDDDHAETLIRLPGCFLSLAVPALTPPVQPGPSESRDYVTFGSFNNFAKINDQVLALWADVLNAVPNSRLLAKSSSSGDPTAQQMIRDKLKSHGVDPGRLEFADYTETLTSHLNLYHDVDIALDTFPYNGTTTTCEALWMGVPVVALLGDRHAARVSASLLNAIGFPAGIATSPEDYVLTARLLAQTPGLLKTLRRSLRETMMCSALCDHDAHARKLEEAFHTVWRMWCEEQNNALD